MKVLCFGRFYDDTPGGMQRHVEHLFAALRDQVDFVHLVPSRDRHAGALTLHGFPVIRTPSLNVDGSLALSPGLFFKARQLHRQHRFDLVHLHFPDPMSHLASLAIPADVPRIISWHADILRHRVLRTFYSGLMNRSVRSASAIIVATPSHISSSPVLTSMADPARLHVIPYGFDLGPIQTPHPLAARLREQHPGRLILAVGRHVSYKGFEVLLKAMPQIGHDAKLLLVGSGPLTESLKRLSEQLGLQQRVHFAGLVPDSDLPAWYQACDLFCLPSVSQAEAFGIVQVEAMACARPVVSTRLNTGVDFVNQDGVTGFTVPPGDQRALGDAINRLLGDDALRERLGSQARQRAEMEFSFRTMGDRTLGIYRDAIESGRPAR